MAETVPEGLPLAGCRPEPLMPYLKALGILRLIGEKDRNARGSWKDEVFWLRSNLDREALVDFLLGEYKPTPILVPWSGNDFFDVRWEPGRPRFAKTPTGSRAIEAILATSSTRFDRYRAALRACRLALEECRIDSKDKMGKNKWEFIESLRSSCAEPGLLDWIDCAAVLTAEKFAPLLGSGGGSDGNTHFSDNFMQNLWDTLPDFDEQRKSKKNQRGQAEPSVTDRSRRQLENALFGVQSHDLVLKRTSALYDSGAVGGANATQGMERASLSNPWDIVLTFEGLVSFAAAAVKRLQATGRGAAFPFQVRTSLTQGGLADKEQAGAEIWLPVWDKPASPEEVLALLREGRAEHGGQRAKSGLDMARAIATLGVDRGIRAFHRYAIVKGRVGGENYNTAASLGRFPVVERAHVDLLHELDPWLESFRRACGRDNVPPRFKAALRRVEQSIFEFCLYGEKMFFQAILNALGRAECELACGERFRDENRIPPVAGLSREWLDAGADDTPEFEVALALAGIFDPEAKIAGLRANLEPVDLLRKEGGKLTAKWAEKDRAVVWNSASLTANLAQVLARRAMDGNRAGCGSLPIASRNSVSLATISRFLAGELDDSRITHLLWALTLVEQKGGTGMQLAAQAGAPPLPRAYALLKLLFLPAPIELDNQSYAIGPESAIPALLGSNRVAEACRIAMRRLRASGFVPLPHRRSGGVSRDADWEELEQLKTNSNRLAAALLFPASRACVRELLDVVIRKSGPELGMS